jgi:hypothetical protein
MSENAGAAERLLQRIILLLAQARAFGLSVHAERVNLCVRLRKYRHGIPEYEEWCGSHGTPKA